MNKNIAKYWLLALTLMSGLFLASCEDDDEDPVLRVNHETFDFETTGGTGHLYIFANQAWEMKVEGGEDWFHPEMTNGPTEGLVYLDVDTNWTVGPDRVANLTITSGSLSVGVKVTQAGLVPVLTVPESVSIPFVGGDKGITINSNIAWTIKNAAEIPSWLTLDVTSGTAGVTTITAKAAQETDVELSFTLIIAGEGVEDQQVKVIQEAPAGVHTPNVQPTDNLNDVIAAAAEGDSLFLAPGTYSVSNKIIVGKGVVIAAAHPFKKPVIEAVFEAPNSCGDITFKNVILSGKNDASLDYCFRFMTNGASYGVLTMDGCEVKDYEKAFIYAGGDEDIALAGLIINDCVVTNIKTNGSDGIDFRGSDVVKIELTNSTFNKVAPARDFLRVDAASGNGLKVLIDHCTFYGCSETKRTGLFNMRDGDTRTTYSNNILVKCSPIGRAGTFTAEGNYYSEVDGTWLSTDKKGTDADPQFKDAAAGDFTVGNGDIRTAKAGDPRWVE